MKPLVTAKGLKIIGVITLVGILVVAIYKHFEPYTFDEQRVKNLAAAERHTLLLKPLIEKDRRFTNVSVGPFTGQGGCLEVSGKVESDTDFLDLRHMVESSAPPVAVYYQVSTPSNYFIYTGQPRTLTPDKTPG